MPTNSLVKQVTRKMVYLQNVRGYEIEKITVERILPQQSRSER
jgi:hypothetical protein